jgi:hypothetical protein
MVSESLQAGKKFRNRPRVFLQADYTEEIIFHTEFCQYK